VHGDIGRVLRCFLRVRVFCRLIANRRHLHRLLSTDACWCFNRRFQPYNVTALWRILISRHADGRRLSWPNGWLHADVVCPFPRRSPIHDPSTNRAQRRITSLIRRRYAKPQAWLITFCVSRRRRKMFCGHARLCVCVCPRPHAHTTARTRCNLE